MKQIQKKLIFKRALYAWLRGFEIRNKEITSYGRWRKLVEKHFSWMRNLVTLTKFDAKIDVVKLFILLILMPLFYLKRITRHEQDKYWIKRSVLRRQSRDRNRNIKWSVYNIRIGSTPTIL